MTLCGTVLMKIQNIYSYIKWENLEINLPVSESTKLGNSSTEKFHTSVSPIPLVPTWIFSFTGTTASFK